MPKAQQPTLVLCADSAIFALRCHRSRNGRINWRPLGAVEQRRALAACVPNMRDIDWDALAAEGVWRAGDGSEESALHVLVSDPAHRRSRGRVVTHLFSGKLPPDSIREVAPGIYAASPQVSVITYARTHSYGETRGFIEELAGRFTLPCGNEADPTQCRSSEPVVTVQELRRWLRKAPESAGQLTALRAAKYALGEARSVMEAIMYGMFASPMAAGGFACTNCKPNERVAFNHDAITASQMPYAICDLLYPKAHITLEYNGEYHDAASARRHDECRSAGLKAMGIDTIALNDEQMRNLSALEAIARTIYRAEGRRFRYRVEGYRKRQIQLLNGLRAWAGLRHV